MQEKLEEDEFNERLVFSDETAFHTNGKVNRHNVHIWDEENPHATSMRETHQKWMRFVPSRKTMFMTHFF